jgi:hypothetical protein
MKHLHRVPIQNRLIARYAGVEFERQRAQTIRMTGTRRPESRRLGIVVKTSPGALPMLVAAGFVSATACGDSTEIRTVQFVDGDASHTGGATGSGGRGTGGRATGGSIFGTSGGAGGIVFSSGGNLGTGGDRLPAGCSEYTVELPVAGNPTAPGQICAVAIDPVDSNGAARVTLTSSPGATAITGLLQFDPAVEPRVVGVPVIEVLDATTPELLSIQIGPLTKVAGGFSFQVTIPQSAYLDPGYSRMTVRTTFDVGCAADGGAAKQVHAATDLHLCYDDGSIGGGSEWVSSGDRCVVCRIIAEMAPSPIVPDKAADGLPLAKALRVRVVELARVSNRVVLFAENDGGEGLDYEWHPSAGTVERIAPDVIVWTVAEGMDAPLMQVAVCGDAEAAVATFAWNQAA